ncbi:MAG: ABC transporter permease [Bacteroidales bacterium]|jgi:peptide/nickel transport system permease protein|nr:ABC transporter permease [Bacteroidales bacterium]
MFRKKAYEASQSLRHLTWKRLLKIRLALIAMIFIGMAVIVAVMGYLITPDSTPFANQQYIEISAQPPGFKANMLKIRKNELAFKQNWFKTMIYGKRNIYTFIPFNSYRFVNDEIILTEFDLFPSELTAESGFNLADVVYPLPQDFKAEYIGSDTIRFYDIEGEIHVNSIAELQIIVKEKYLVERRFWLGSDRYGRDVLSQLMIGTRVSLSVGIISVLISLMIGIMAGALGGYFRGWVDNLIVWLINVVWSIPTLLLVIAITFALGKGFWQVFVAVGLTMWVEVARVVRGQVLSIREKEYIEAARALGFRHWRIITRHILPNVIGPVIVISAANFASAILIEAGLSFLGIGVQPPMPSWGTMIKENYTYIILDKAYLAILPGIAIMLMVLSFMIIGNGLRDALDIKTIDNPGKIQV